MPLVFEGLPPLGPCYWRRQILGSATSQYEAPTSYASTAALATYSTPTYACVATVGRRITPMLCQKSSNISIPPPRATGQWTATHLHATAFYSRRLNSVYTFLDNGLYQQYVRRTHHNTRHPEYIRVGNCHQIPTDALPTTTKGSFGRIQHTGVTGHVPIVTCQTDDWWGIVTTATLPIADLVLAIQQGTAIAVTDGSFKDTMGTVAFTLRTACEDTQSITCVHMTPGLPSDMTPYRTELGGILGIASFR